MTDEERIKLMEALTRGGINAKQFVVENTGSITYNDYGEGQRDGRQPVRQADSETVGRALAKCGALIWGNAAYAVAFCVCRDKYGWQDNASFFERQMELLGIHFPAGTVNATMSRNPYMKLHVDKWQENGAMERVLKLRDGLQSSIDA